MFSYHCLQTISHVSDHIVPLVIPDKSGQPRAVHVVLTSSEEDKSILMVVLFGISLIIFYLYFYLSTTLTGPLFQGEIQNLEDEHNLKVRGFREVIDVISSSNKPIIGYNCLHGGCQSCSSFVILS